MLKLYAEGQIRKLKAVFINNSLTMLLSAVILFTALNSLKITLFNYFIIPRHSPAVFQYKLVYTLLVSAVFYSVFLRLKTKVLLFVFYIIQLLYILTNISYYSYFHNYLHPADFIALFGEGFSAFTHSAAPFNLRLLTAFIDLPVFLFIMFRYIKVPALIKGLGFIITAVFALCLFDMARIEVNNYKAGHSLINYIKDKYDGESPIVERYGTLVNSLVGVLQNGSHMKMIESFQYGREQSGPETVNSRPNFVIIQVESMDSSIVKKKYQGKYITPYLSSLSDKCIFYPYVLGYHSGGGTSDAEFAVINSIQPLKDFPAFKVSGYAYPNSMAKELLYSGYSTLAFHGNAGNFFNRDVAFGKMGFEHFFDINGMRLKDIGWGAPDGDVFNYALKALQLAEQPFFAYIITMTSHGPFTNTRNYYNNKLYDGIRDETVRNYFNSMSYVDQTVEALVNNIKSSFKDTYIVIIGDHTPSISSEYYRQASYLSGENYCEFVPLFILSPDERVYKEKKLAASLLDLSPTILKASGIQFSINSDGMDLMNLPGCIQPIPFGNELLDRQRLFSRIKRIRN